jgi:hypothetical protein
MVEKGHRRNDPAGQGAQRRLEGYMRTSVISLHPAQSAMERVFWARGPDDRHVKPNLGQ